MAENALTLVGVGDICIEREEPHEILRHVVHVLSGADITFANSEQVHSDKGTPSPTHAVFSHPRNIPALVDAGIDVLNLANNHTMDWGAAGIVDTIDRLDAVNMPHVGAGRTIVEAREPVFITRGDTTVGFLGYCSVGPDGYEATESRPGFAPVRAWTVYDKIDYQPGTPPRVVTVPFPEDTAAMVEDIKAARAQCDILVLSMHWGLHFVPAVIPDYCTVLGRAAVDAGADLVLGTHAHILKGAEIYKGKAIFYSTGNFAVEVSPSPHMTDAVQKFVKHYGLDPGFPAKPWHPDAHYSMIVKCTIAGREIQDVAMIPCFINEDNEPEIKTRADEKGRALIEYMSRISSSEDLPISYEWNEDGTEIRLLAPTS